MGYDKIERHAQNVDKWCKTMDTAADRKRLDWLQTQTGARLRSFGTYWTLEASSEEVFRANTLREAIDKAMETK